jgi:hypothetical protein
VMVTTYDLASGCWAGSKRILVVLAVEVSSRFVVFAPPDLLNESPHLRFAYRNVHRRTFPRNIDSASPPNGSSLGHSRPVLAAKSSQPRSLSRRPKLAPWSGVTPPNPPATVLATPLSSFESCRSAKSRGHMTRTLSGRGSRPCGGRAVIRVDGDAGGDGHASAGGAETTVRAAVWFHVSMSVGLEVDT